MKVFLVIVAIFVVIAILFGVGYLFLYGFELLASVVPVPVSAAFMCFGIIMLIIGKLRLSKKYVYHKDANEVRLDTPLFSDYAYVFGVISLVTGLITFQPLISAASSGDWEGKLFFALMALFAVFKLFQMVVRLRNALHDKIIIGKDTIRLDDPMGSSSREIAKGEIMQIKYLKNFERGRYGYSSSNYSLKLFIELNAKEGAEAEKVSIDPTDMNLKLDYLIDALRDMNYEVKLRSCRSGGEEWDGHDFQ